MMGTLPSCQAFSKKVQVLEQLLPAVNALLRGLKAINTASAFEPTLETSS
jgi:hypothetical protein